jgi:predicted dehydrogenase
MTRDRVSTFLAGVDGVAFAVPPDVQAPIAVRAARAGKHLLLEKPIALAEAEADDLVEALEQAHVASVVFFTLRFQADMRTWLADVSARGGWAGGMSSASWRTRNARSTHATSADGGMPASQPISAVTVASVVLLWPDE